MTVITTEWVSLVKKYWEIYEMTMECRCVTECKDKDLLNCKTSIAIYGSLGNTLRRALSMQSTRTQLPQSLANGLAPSERGTGLLREHLGGQLIWALHNREWALLGIVCAICLSAAKPQERLLYLSYKSVGYPICMPCWSVAEELTLGLKKEEILNCGVSPDGNLIMRTVVPQLMSEKSSEELVI